MRTTKTWRSCLGIIAAATIVMSGCGGDDDDAVDEPAPAADDDDGGNDDGGNDNGGDDDGGDDGESADLGDIPDNCRDMMGDFLEEIEPIVEDIDWKNATIDDFESLGEEFDAAATEMEARVGDAVDECDDIDLAAGSEDSLALITEIAEDRAPGVLAFLSWQQGLLDDMADISIPDVSLPSMSDISIPDLSLPAMPEGTPETCEDAIAYVEDAIVEHGSLNSMPLEAMTAFANASQVISTECTVDEVAEFFGRPELQDFLGG